MPASPAMRMSCSKWCRQCGSINQLVIMRPEDLLCPTPRGLYCPPADAYVDPMQPVPRALITHGHSDHARAGHGAVMATSETLRIMEVRYGEDFARERHPLRLGEVVAVNGVDISFHPAGHVLGSAQILLEWKGHRTVVSGDYKRLPDRTAGTFEPLRCNLFVTEATFGLPVFRHPPTGQEVAKLLDSVSLFPERTHLVGAYPLGKAQRLMALVRDAGYDKPIYVHGALVRLTELYESLGIALGGIVPVNLDERKLQVPPIDRKDLRNLVHNKPGLNAGDRHNHDAARAIGAMAIDRVPTALVDDRHHLAAQIHDAFDEIWRARNASQAFRMPNDLVDGRERQPVGGGPGSCCVRDS